MGIDDTVGLCHYCQMTASRNVPKVCEKCGRDYLAFPGNKGRFCSRKCYWDTGGNSANRKDFRDPRLNPSEQAMDPDYIWAAGVYEGEGTCHGNQWTWKDGRVTTSPALRVNQVDPWLCNRLRSLFGGSVRLRRNGHGNGVGNADVIHPRPYEIYEWNLNGARAREFLRAIYDRLSPRRQGQVRKAFGLSDDQHP